MSDWIARFDEAQEQKRLNPDPEQREEQRLTEEGYARNRDRVDRAFGIVEHYVREANVRGFEFEYERSDGMMRIRRGNLGLHLAARRNGLLVSMLDYTRFGAFHPIEFPPQLVSYRRLTREEVSEWVHWVVTFGKNGRRPAGRAESRDWEPTFRMMRRVGAVSVFAVIVVVVYLLWSRYGFF